MTNKTYLICYDINKEGAAYSAANRLLTARIRELFSTFWHHLDSTWIIETSLDHRQIRDALLPYIDDNDELLVVQSSGTAAWSQSFTQKAQDWLRRHL